MSEHGPFREGYVPPYDQMDPIMAEVCKAINETGWVWTIECCDGHAEQEGQRNRIVPGGCPYVRLAVTPENAARVLRTLDIVAPVEAGVNSIARIVLHQGLFGPEWRVLTIYVEPIPGFGTLARARHTLCRFGFGLKQTVECG